MKFKMFLRGLGAGIIFTTIIMLITFASFGKYKMSDKEIKEKAKKLGMVEATTENSSEETKTTTEETTAELLTEDMTVSTESTTTESAVEDDATTESATTEKTTKVDTMSDEYIVTKITIKSGMDSTDVCKMLENVGIIEDYQDFDNYLNSNNYSTSIRVDTFELNNNMSYEEIAAILTKR